MGYVRDGCRDGNAGPQRNNIYSTPKMMTPPLQNTPKMRIYFHPKYYFVKPWMGVIDSLDTTTPKYLKNAIIISKILISQAVIWESLTPLTPPLPKMWLLCPKYYFLKQRYGSHWLPWHHHYQNTPKMQIYFLTKILFSQTVIWESLTPLTPPLPKYPKNGNIIWPKYYFVKPWMGVIDSLETTTPNMPHKCDYSFPNITLSCSVMGVIYTLDTTTPKISHKCDYYSHNIILSSSELEPLIPLTSPLLKYSKNVIILSTILFVIQYPFINITSSCIAIRDTESLDTSSSIYLNRAPMIFCLVPLRMTTICIVTFSHKF